MTQPNFNTGGDSDWDDRGGVLWNEHDWQQYLKTSDEETTRFLAAYLKHRHEPNHLDEVAHRLGWDRGEWAVSPNEEEDDEEDEDEPTASMGAHWPEGEEIGEAAVGPMGMPYTVHRHPVFIATRGLCLHLGRVWHHFFVKHPHVLPGVLGWNLFGALHGAELNAVMAIHAVDLGDFNLAVCHLKNGLSAINHAFKVLQSIPEDVVLNADRILQDTRATLFDLREIWLRVIQDCREEAKFEGDGGEGVE